MDVNVLMASQLFVEVASSSSSSSNSKQPRLLQQFYHSVLLDFRSADLPRLHTGRWASIKCENHF
jgi:hypothetical protein